jgi:hypothetical protein
MLDWLLSVFSSIISFFMGLFGCGGETKSVRFEDEVKGGKTEQAESAPPAETPSSTE